MLAYNKNRKWLHTPGEYFRLTQKNNHFRRPLFSSTQNFCKSMKNTLCRRSDVARLFHDRQRLLRGITKTLLVMKLTILFLTVAFLNVSAKGLSQTVTISGKDMPLKKVFSLIEQQTGF